MTQQTSPFLESKYGWNFGESGWNAGMDENLLKFSFMFDRNVDSITTSLPSAVNGQAHYLTTDNRLYFAVGTTYFSTPVPKWFIVVERSTGQTYQYNGTALVQIDSPVQLDTRLDAVELTVASLGTAAFEDVKFFATQAELDVVEAGASAYTDALRQDLADDVGPFLGASLIGRGAVAVDSIVSLLSQPTGKGQHISVASYHQGWATTTEGPLGASVWAWDATEPKANHNGFDKISPTVPWTGAFATMNAFQTGTGETAPGTNGCWLRIHGANDLVSWGGLPTAGVDNFLPMSKAIAWAYNSKRRLKVNSGTFEYSSTLDVSYPGLCMRGTDMMGTVFKYTGGGRCMDILGTRPNNGAFSIGIELTDFTVQGNANVIDIIRIRINHCVLRNINLREAAPTGCGLRVEGVVLGHFENVVCSTGRQLMTSRPLRGIILDADPTDGRRASANIWTNLIVEGMLEDGIHFIAADTQIFNGGTSENSDGLGVYIPALCRVNTFNCVGFENRGYADVFDDGQMNRFINCYGTKKIYHGPNSTGHYVRGGYWQNVEGDINAKYPDIDDIQFNFLPLVLAPTGAFVVASITAQVGLNISNVIGGVPYYHKKPATVVTPTSGILITNSTGIDVDYYVTGGTVSAITEYRFGSPFLTLPTSGKFRILPGDGLVITFSVAPTVTRVPRSS